MIGMVFDDADRTIQLFTKNKPCHGVRQGQAGQANAVVRLLLQALIDAIGTANDERCVPTFTHPVFQALRELEGAQVGAAFIEHDDPAKALQSSLQAAFLGGQQLLAVF